MSQPEWEMVRLQGHEHADVVIAGVDLTGLMLGALLCRQGMRVILLEMGDIGAGCFCAGLASPMQPVMLQRTLHHRGKAAAQQYLRALTRMARDLPQRLPRGIAGRISHSQYASHAAMLPLLAQQQRLCRQLGIPVIRTDGSLHGPLNAAGRLLLPGQWLVDLPAFMAHLRRSITSRGGRLCLHAPITEIRPDRVCTRDGCADADVVVLSGGLLPGMPHSPLLPLLEHRTLALMHLHGGIPLTACMTPAHSDGLSLCPADGGVLAVMPLGPTGLNGQSARLRRMRQLLLRHLPDDRPGPVTVLQEVRSRDGLPIAGEIPGSGGRLLCAAGCGGLGLPGSALAARALQRAILGAPAPEDALLRPDRAIPASLRHRHHAASMRGRLRVHAPRCTCRRGRLRYSRAAAAWQCPVCGSVFGAVGQRLAGPSLRSADVTPSRRPL